MTMVRIYTDTVYCSSKYSVQNPALNNQKLPFTNVGSLQAMAGLYHIGSQLPVDQLYI
jgi:hypothetical protein